MLAPWMACYGATTNGLSVRFVDSAVDDERCAVGPAFERISRKPLRSFSPSNYNLVRNRIADE